MSDGIWSAASGAIGQVTALDVAADNIANASTPGFRGNRAVFREVLTRAVSKRSGGFNLDYSVAATPAADVTHGPISVTGRPLDVAIRGDSFLVVKTPQGERYTRSGSLQVNRDGVLLAPSGDPVLGVDKRPIRVAPDAPVTVDSDGTVRTGATSAGPTAAGQLLLVDFEHPAGLSPEGHFLVCAQAAAGKASVSAGALEVGALEEANVSPVRGMIDIVNASRSFEICEKAVEAFRDADRRAATDLMSFK
jgi:flagellar basal-body rod protein FlgF